jgi:hypothetical protein
MQDSPIHVSICQWEYVWETVHIGWWHAGHRLEHSSFTQLKHLCYAT